MSEEYSSLFHCLFTRQIQADNAEEHANWSLGINSCEEKNIIMSNIFMDRWPAYNTVNPSFQFQSVK